jgi:hypothetical protein
MTVTRKPPILDLEQREELRKSAQYVLDQNPGGRWKFVEGCLSLIAELEIKESIIEQLGSHKLETRETRCGSMTPMRTGMYRCIMERGDGHTEHQYNYFRALTKQEKEHWYPGEDLDS